MSISRRNLLLGGTAVAGFGVSMLFRQMPSDARAVEGTFEVTKTDEEWKAQLDDASYRVLRHEDTERPFTSPLNDEHRAGTFLCKGCDLPLFDSATKYDSGTGWPSFYQPLENAVGDSTDYKLGYGRTEVHCRRCGGHLGHVFPDGPPPTGLRYCINGVSLIFTPSAA